MRKRHLDHEIRGLLDIEHGKPQAPERDAGNAGGCDAPDRI